MSSGTTPRDRLVAAVIAALIASIAALPLIASDDLRGRAAADALNYHEVAIRAFASAWPSFDFSNYASATTPLWHVVLATVAHVVSDERVALRLVNLLLSLGMYATLAAFLAGRAGWRRGVALSLPFMASVYVALPGAYLLPDNAAWWVVLGILLLSLSPASARHLWGASALLVVLVLLRQVHLWAAAMIWTSAMVGPVVADDALLPRPIRPALIRLLLSAAATIPALLVVAAFARLWGGVVPPTFQHDVQGGNPAVPAFILAQLALASVPVWPVLMPAWREAWTTRRARLVAAALIGAAIGALVPTDFSEEAGRYSGYWAIVRVAPEIGSRSVLLILGSAAGAVTCLLWLTTLPRRTSLIIAAALLAFIAAQSANHYAWQRYHEPFILMLVPILAVCVRESDPGARWRFWRDFGPVVFALLLALVTGATVLRAEKAPDRRAEVERAIAERAPPP